MSKFWLKIGLVCLSAFAMSIFVQFLLKMHGLSATARSRELISKPPQLIFEGEQKNGNKDDENGWQQQQQQDGDGHYKQGRKQQKEIVEDKQSRQWQPSKEQGIDNSENSNETQTKLTTKSMGIGNGDNITWQRISTEMIERKVEYEQKNSGKTIAPEMQASDLDDGYRLGAHHTWSRAYRSFFSDERYHSTAVSTASEQGLCLTGERASGHMVRGAHNAKDFTLSLWLKATSPCAVLGPTERHDRQPRGFRSLTEGLKSERQVQMNGEGRRRRSENSPWFANCMLIGPSWAAPYPPGDIRISQRVGRSYNDFGVALAPNGSVVFGIGHRLPLAPSRRTNGADGWDYRSPGAFNPVTNVDFVHEGNETEVWSHFPVDDGRWHHIVATRRMKTGELGLYIDGMDQGHAISSNRELMSDSAYDLAVGLSIVGCVRGASFEHRYSNTSRVQELLSASSSIMPPTPKPALHLCYLFSPESDQDVESRTMRDQFVASIRSWGDDDILEASKRAVILEEVRPATLSLSDGSVGPSNRTTAKIRLVEYALSSHSEGDIVVVSDIDLRFYRPFVELVHEYMVGRDMVFQRDNDYTIQANVSRTILSFSCRLPVVFYVWPLLRSVREQSMQVGFMAFRVNARSKAFWKAVKAQLSTARHPNDQKVLNMILISPERHGVSLDLTPRWVRRVL